MQLAAPTHWQPPLGSQLPARAADTLFPLRLTPFEEYLYLDHRAGNSMVFCVRFVIAGNIERAAFEQALLRTAADNPLIQATIRKRWGGRYHWTLERDVQPGVTWNEASQYSYQLPRLDLSVEAGLRIDVVNCGESSRINVFLHHAVGDGVACFRVIEQLLVNYALITGVDPQTIRQAPLDPLRLAKRGRKRWGSYQGWQWIKSGLHEFWKFYGQVPTPLRSQAKTPLPENERTHEFIEATLSQAETRGLRLAAHAQELTVNELLISELFCCLADWNDRDRPPNDVRPRDPWYRVTMPTNMREPADERTPAANIVSMAFFNRRRSSITVDSPALRRSIQTESLEIRTRHRGELLLDSFAILRAIPGLISLMMRLPICMSSAVLTNMGDPCRRFTTRFRWDSRGMIVGNLRLLSMSGIPPLRQRTNVVMGALVFGQRLTLSVQMSPEFFRRRDSEEFLELYLNRIRRHCSSSAIS